jgi:hypothetical protein
MEQSIEFFAKLLLYLPRKSYKLLREDIKGIVKSLEFFLLAKQDKK